MGKILWLVRRCGYDNCDFGDGGDGIYLANADFNTIVGGQSGVLYGTPTQPWGIYGDGSSDYNTIVSVTIKGNTAGAITMAGTGNKIKSCVGFKNENYGTSFIANGSTSVVVNHGCDFTPIQAEITITIMGYPGGTGVTYYVGNPNSTQFTVYANINAGRDVYFGWAVRQVSP